MINKISILFLYNILLLAYIFNRGFYSFVGSLTLLICIIISIIIVVQKGKTKKIIDNLENITLFLTVFFSIFLYGGIYQKIPLYYFVSQLLLFIELILVIFMKPKKPLLFSSFIIFFLVSIFMILSSPAPTIDVYHVLKEGSEAIFKSQNPYSITYTKIYRDFRSDYFTYFPGMLYFISPGVILFGDPRVSILIYVLISATIIYKFFKSINLSLIFLFNPVFFFILEQSYTEPLVFFLILCCFILLTKKRFKLSAAVFTLLLGTKQYAVLILPFYYLFVKDKVRSIIPIFIGIGLLIFLPFLIWDFNEFIKDAVILQFIYPERYDGLTFFSLIYDVFHIRLPFYTFSIIWFLSLVYLLFKIDKSKFSNLILRIFIFLSIFFYFNKMAFVNYYYLLSSLLLLVAGFLKNEQINNIKGINKM